MRVSALRPDGRERLPRVSVPALILQGTPAASACRLILLVLAVLAGAFAPPLLAEEAAPPARSESAAAEAISACLECHADPDLTMTLEDGQAMSLEVRAEHFAASVHGRQLVCTDCHEGFDGGEHPDDTTYPSRVEFVRQSAGLCKTCHFEAYTRGLESVHFEQLRQGSDVAPVCSDCHGAHDIGDPHEKSAMMSRSCGACHGDEHETYSASVHGKALLEDGVIDAPACADCHTAHRVVAPGTASFRMASPEICAGCHGDEERMRPYGLSADVATSYLADFHGVTARLSRGGEVDSRQVVVTCIDCHGVHDIVAPGTIEPAVMKERVRAVCSGCHQGAATDFPAAWLSHYRPSLRHAPLVYLVNLGYKIFIPFMVLGLLLQVLLHLYRVAIRR